MTGTTTTPSLFDDAELDAILGALDDDSVVAAPIPAAPAVLNASTTEDDIESALDAIEVEADLKEALMSKDVEADVIELAPVKAAKEVKVPIAKSSSSRGAGLSSMAPSQAILKLYGAETKGIELTKGLTSEIDCMDSLAKKVKEKIVNVLEAAKRGVAPSVYTQRAIALLKEHGHFTSNQLRDDYLSRPYSPGTASAQCSQMMIALPALKIATREGSKLVLNENSTLYPLIVAAMAHPSAVIDDVSETDAE